MADNAKKFERNTWEMLCEYVEYGLTHATACEALNITEATLYRWVKRGRDEPDEFPEYAEFYERWISAEAEFEAYHAGNIHRASRGDAKLSLLALERRRPKRWGKRAVIDTTWEDRLAKMGKNPQEIMDILLAVIKSGKSFEEIMDAIDGFEYGGDPFGSDDGDGDGPSPEPVETDMDPPGGTST